MRNTDMFTFKYQPHFIVTVFHEIKQIIQITP